MLELYKAIGGLPGLVALLLAGGLLFWRVKIPQIGLEYLQRELEINRNEIAEADKDRIELRTQVHGLRNRLVDLERDYMHCLADREKCRRHIRHLERQVRDLGGEPIIGEEER